MLAEICRAIREGCTLELCYAGFTSIVEPHCYSAGTAGRELLLCWQVRGGSVHSAPTGWKQLHVDRIVSIRVGDIPSLAPRPGFKRRDPDMGRIFCEV